MKPSKCFLGFDNLVFLGHHLTAGKIAPEEEKIRKLQETPRPTTKKQVKSFLGLAGDYRRFIPSFAEVATPLTDATKKGKPEQVVWDAACEKAFTGLKQELCSKPILIMPDPEKDYILHTDASDVGMGVVLLQEMDGVPHPVSYASKKFNAAQKNYAVIEKEGLAVAWACKYFHQHLYC